MLDEYQFAQGGRQNSETLDEKMSFLFLRLLFHVGSSADRLYRDFADTLYITESRTEGKRAFELL